MLYQRICIPLRNFKACASGFEDPALRDSLAGASGFLFFG
jgi:hypothetical protein